MNFGHNLFSWIQPELQWLVLVAIAIIGVYYAIKKEFTKLIVVGIVAVIAVLLVFDTVAMKDVLLHLGQKVIGTGGKL